MRWNLRIAIACLLGASLIGGCNKSAKKAKKHNKPAPAPPAATLAAEPREPGPFTWKMPAGWSERGTAEPMRYATLAAEDGQEVAISAFPGDVGGNLRN